MAKHGDKPKVAGPKPARGRPPKSSQVISPWDLAMDFIRPSVTRRWYRFWAALNAPGVVQNCAKYMKIEHPSVKEVAQYISGGGKIEDSAQATDRSTKRVSHAAVAKHGPITLKAFSRFIKPRPNTSPCLPHAVWLRLRSLLMLDRYEGDWFLKGECFHEQGYVIFPEWAIPGKRIELLDMASRATALIHIRRVMDKRRHDIAIRDFVRDTELQDVVHFRTYANRGDSNADYITEYKFIIPFVQITLQDLREIVEAMDRHGVKVAELWGAFRPSTRKAAIQYCMNSSIKISPWIEDTWRESRDKPVRAPLGEAKSGTATKSRRTGLNTRR